MILFLKKQEHLLLMLIFFLVQCQEFRAQINDNIPSGAKSLAFVFDTTGSMSDDLEQAKAGAAKILATTLSQKTNPLYNYILVPFNDPVVGPVYETTNPEQFKNQLASLTVDGGGDCPEMCIGGIHKAIEVCLPRSYIYVFTDASAKDANRTQEVIALNHEKQSQVVFVLTGECGETTDENVYNHIASTSSGQVFNLGKAQVGQVLDFVRVSIQSNTVNLLSIDMPSSSTNTQLLHVDSHLNEFTVSLSGPSPSIRLNDNKGIQVSGMTVLLNIGNAYIVNMKDPSPGQWSVITYSTGPHTLRITGQSDVSFQMAFSPSSTLNTSSTDFTPFVGDTTYIYFNVSGLLPPGNLSQIELLSIDGKSVDTINLNASEANASLYISEPFSLPGGYFYVKVLGTDENGFILTRLSATPITGRQPSLPTVKMNNVTTNCFGSTAVITCSVEGQVSYNVTWYRGETQVGDEMHFLKPEDVTLEIPNAEMFPDRIYVCNVSNSAGSVAVSTLLNITCCLQDVDYKNICGSRTRYTCKPCNCETPAPDKYVPSSSEWTASMQYITPSPMLYEKYSLEQYATPVSKINIPSSYRTSSEQISPEQHITASSGLPSSEQYVTPALKQSSSEKYEKSSTERLLSQRYTTTFSDWFSSEQHIHVTPSTGWSFLGEFVTSSVYPAYEQNTTPSVERHSSVQYIISSTERSSSVQFITPSLGRSLSTPSVRPSLVEFETPSWKRPSSVLHETPSSKLHATSLLEYYLTPSLGHMSTEQYVAPSLRQPSSEQQAISTARYDVMPSFDQLSSEKHVTASLEQPKKSLSSDHIKPGLEQNETALSKQYVKPFSERPSSEQFVTSSSERHFLELHSTPSSSYYETPASEWLSLNQYVTPLPEKHELHVHLSRKHVKPSSERYETPLPDQYIMPSPDPCIELKKLNCTAALMHVPGTKDEQTSQTRDSLSDSLSVVSGIIGAAIALVLETTAVLVYNVIQGRRKARLYKTDQSGQSAPAVSNATYDLKL